MLFNKGRWFGLAIAMMAIMSLPAVGQQTEDADKTIKTDGPVDHSERRTREPVFRVPNRDKVEKKSDTPDRLAANLPNSNSKSSQPIGNGNANPGMVNPAIPAAVVAASPASPAPHPLDRALTVAETALANFQADVKDYTAILVKRERVNNKLGERNYMQIKVRNGRTTAAGNVPFSIYMKFLKPREVAGREVVWVKGKNNGKLIAHEARGVGSLARATLDPDGWIAMRGNRYPIYEAGIENLIIKLIEKAERDRGAGACQVEYRPGATINKRPCTMIEVIHPQARAPFDFHKAQVFIDDELQIPIRYAAYGWPEKAGGAPVLMEEYTYVQVKLNVGLTDKDFDPNNANYNYPGR